MSASTTSPGVPWEDGAMGREFELDLDAFELRYDGELVDLEPQALSVAVYLIEHRHRLIPKEELLDEIWGDRFVSESALSTRIKQVRRAFGDNGSDQRVVKTVHGKGYRFIGDVAVRSATLGDVGPAAATGRATHNLPQLRTGLIGRRAELDASVVALGDNRLTTMFGIGGVGKTTLATAVGHAAIDSFPDGVWFVDLVPVTDTDQLLLAMARAAGLSLRTGSAIDQISSIITDRQLLFVLDNCEHVLDPVAATVDRLLDATRTPRFLLTSREPLGLHGEARVHVEPLPAADDGGPAVELFAACASKYGVDLGDEDWPAAAEVCRQLDGLPLAIELAAAQLRHLTLDDLASRLGGRFDLLVGPRLADRHASLATVLEATWASITHDEREVLRQLAHCPGTVSVDDLVELMDQPENVTLRSLARLVDCSLLVRSADGRYRMLETVRSFSAASDDEDGRAARRDRLAEWCSARVGTDVTTHALDLDVAEWCRNHDDLLDVAESHLATDRPDDAAMLVAAQGLAMHVDDGSRAAEILLHIDEHLRRVDDPDLRARLHLTGVYAAMAARDVEALAVHGVAAVDDGRRGGNPSTLGIALVLRSWSEVGVPEQALATVVESASVADAAGDQRTFDLAEGYRAWHLALSRRYDEAIEVARAVLARAPERPGYETFCTAAALVTCRTPRDPEEALQLYESFLDLPVMSSMMTELSLATLHAASGAVAPTCEIVLAVDQRLRRAGRHSLPDVLVPTAMLAHALGQPERAGRYVAAIHRSHRPTQSMQMTSLYQQLRGMVDRVADDQRSTEEVGRDALAWLEDLSTA